MPRARAHRQSKVFTAAGKGARMLCMCVRVRRRRLSETVRLPMHGWTRTDTHGHARTRTVHAVYAPVPLCREGFRDRSSSVNKGVDMVNMCYPLVLGYQTPPNNTGHIMDYS